MGRPNLYSGGINTSALKSKSGREIDLRKQMDCFLFGGDGWNPHASLHIIRRMRRDDQLEPIECTCMRAKQTIEPDPKCTHCLGEGYLFDEEWVYGYSQPGGADSGLVARQVWMPPGGIRVDYRIFYFRYNANIRYGDKIVVATLDEEGRPVVPLSREVIYKPQTIAQMRSDNGRIEYFTVYCREEDAVRQDVYK